MAKLQETKKTLDTRVDSQRFTYIARRESEYMEAEQRFKTINSFLEKNLADARQYEKDMYSIVENY